MLPPPPIGKFLEPPLYSMSIACSDIVPSVIQRFLATLSHVLTWNVKRLLYAFFSLWRYSPRRSLFAWRDTYIWTNTSSLVSFTICPGSKVIPPRLLVVQSAIVTHWAIVARHSMYWNNDIWIDKIYSVIGWFWFTGGSWIYGHCWRPLHSTIIEALFILYAVVTLRWKFIYKGLFQYIKGI